MLYYIEVIDELDKIIYYYEDNLNIKSILKRVKEQIGRDTTIIKIGISREYIEKEC